MKSVLLVEDDKDDQDTFVLALNDIEDVQLFDIANNGTEALRTLKRSFVLPDLVFMDDNMPGMTGMECLLEIERDKKLRSIPVVMLTSDASKKEKAYELGARAFIQKTSNDKDLIHQIQQVLKLCVN